MSGTRSILLENTGNFAIVDDEDYEYISSFGKWYENDGGYAIKKTRINGANVTIRMHRLLAQAPKGLVVDHINGNRLDNRKSNLRCVSQQINSWNRQNNDQHSVYELPYGISYDKSRNKYVATRTIRRRFDTLEEAVNFNKGSELLYVRQ